MKKHFLYGAAFFLLFMIQVFAQNSNQTTTNQPKTEADEKNSDLVITATVRAKELKFEIVPTPKVTFPGSGERQTVWESDRTNLPERVEPGVVYRDIGIRLRIYSRFAEIQRIVLEALDEPQQSTVTPGVTPPPTSNAAPQTTGKVLNQRTVGSILDTAATGLRVVGETTNNSGQIVRRLQDSSGAIIEVVLDTAGKIVSSRVVSGATNRQQ